MAQDGDRARGPEGAPDALMTREEVLGGLPARRARTVLFLIESRTAHLVAKSRQVMQRVLTEQAERERDLAFLEAFALGREPPLKPTIQDLERQAPRWAALVPESPRLRAALAQLFGEKYRFAGSVVPNLRAALHLDDAAVQQAYRQLYRQPLETIFAPQTGPRDRLRWVWAAAGRRLESLPPFWTAFALTLTETVGAGILALPIALAGVGPLAGVALLVLLGALNVLTVAALAEAAARSASVRYQNAFFGRVVGEFLGGTAALIASGAVTAICVTGLLAYYLGLAGTLGDATPVPPAVWMLVLFATQLYFLSRQSLNSTVASALVTGAVNICLVLGLAFLAARHARADNLLYVNVPFLDGRPFDPGILRLIFGVILIAYCGHLSVGNCAQVVLRRDPSGRGLLWGCAAAQGAAIVLYAAWVLAVNGAVAPARLAGRSGTVLGALAESVGPAVYVFGSIYAVLAMGMASIHLSLGLFNLVRDRLPRPSRQVLVLPRGRVRLIFRESRGARPEARLALEYLGRVAGEARFRADIPAGAGTRRVDFGVAGRWDAAEALSREPDVHSKDMAVSFQVLEADDERVRLHVESALSVSVEGNWTAPGPGLADVLELADDERRVVTWLARHGEAGLAGVAAGLGADEAAMRGSLDRLVERGIVERVEGTDGPRFRTRFASRRTRTLPSAIWDAVAPAPAAAARLRAGWTAGTGALVARVRDGLLSPRGRFALAVSPIVALFLFAEWLMLVGADSFSEALNIGGVIGASLIAGILPVLLLASTARKGEIVPRARAVLLGMRWTRAAVYTVFLAGLASHGLLIWEGRVERACALAVTGLVIGATLAMARRGAFARRMTVELRQDDGRSVINVVDDGRPRPAEVSLRYAAGESSAKLAPGEGVAADGLASVALPLGDTAARELKVWTHRMAAGGESEALPATVTVDRDGRTARFDLALSGGQAVLPVDGADRVEIALARPSAP